MNNKKIQIALPVFFAIAVILGMFIGYKLHSNMPISKSFFGEGNRNKIDEVMELVRQRYVDDIGLDTTADKAIEHILLDLDPHSVYIPTSSLKEVNEDLEGKFEGIGIEFNVFNDTVHVLSVLNNGPAFKAGIKIGDKIISVNDSLAIGKINTDKFKSWVKGPGGSSVRIALERDHSIFTKNIIRGVIPIYAIDAAYMIDKEKGYIKLNRFSGSAYEEFMQALEKLKNQGLKKLVLDLKDNGGGILDEAVNIADEFIAGNQLIVYTEGKHQPRRDYLSKRPGLFEEGELIILMNENSASASEVLAGALQDLDRAKIIGRRSFGKGLVQEQYSLSDGSALRLTVARYFTPLGRSIQKSYQNGTEAYKEEIINRMHHLNDPNADSLLEKGSKKYKTAKGKILFGGGGIWPDEIIPMVTSFADTSINKLYTNNIIGNFAYRLFLQEKNKLESFKSAEEFNKEFNISSDSFMNLIRFAKENGSTEIVLNNEAKSFVALRIKALIARIIWNDEGYFKVLNGADKFFIVANSKPNN